jgi:hypothetical protein
MRSVAIITGVETHLDHLGILSDILQIPLIVTEDKTFELAKKFYPAFDVSLRYLSDLSLDYLSAHWDVIFETGKFWAADLAGSLELLYGKKMRFVFCPHGNSDKGYSSQELVSQDLSLVYGNHLLDLLKWNGSFDKIKKIVATGNYRLSYYLKHKTFYDRLAQKEVFDRFEKNKPVVLYAPTWSNKENSSSFFTATHALIEQLAADFNLLIKLHPFLLEYHPAHAYALMGRYDQHPSVLFLTDFPPIYPLLEKSICYIGDYSSIGYDFLALDRPLFFIPSSKSPSSSYASPLYRCGLTLLPEDLSQVKEKIYIHCKEGSDSYSSIRQETYLYAFGREKKPEELRQDILCSI